MRSLLFALASLLSACSPSAVSEQNHIDENFKSYWYDGNAELARYRLIQARYGERHEGTAVIITVTEDFLPGKQVKVDNYPADSAVSVLKVNHTRQFWTGIYPYSLMMSVFTPLNGQSQKITTSVQDWCGHVFTQLNLRNKNWMVQSRSYFESEADQDYTLDGLPAEDEVWTKIRLNPESLPVGAFSLIPGTLYSRLNHDKLIIRQASCQWIETDSLKTYTIHYQSIKRTISWTVDKQFPHAIIRWQETGMNFGKQDTTTAELVKTLRAPYWQLHNPADSVHRQLLMGF